MSNLTINLLDENFFKVTEFDKDTWKALRELLSFKTQEYFYGKPIWTTKYLLHGNTKIGSTGLIPKIVKEFPFVKINDARLTLKPIIFDIEKLKEELDDYQFEVSEKLFKVKRAIVQLPTGAGKTYLMARLVKSMKEKVVIISPSEEIIKQLQTHLDGSDVGLVWSEFEELDKRVILSTGQTLSSRYEYYDEDKVFKDVRVVIADEAQYYGANTFFRAMHLFPNADYRWGFSATPTGRSDNADLRISAVFGANTVTTTQEIERVLPLKIWMINYNSLESTSVSSSLCAGIDDHKVIEYEDLLEYPKRLKAIQKVIDMLKAEEKSFLIFTDRLKYGEAISTMCDIPFVSANSELRSTIFDDLRAKKLLGFVSTIGTVGVDVPNLEVIVNVTRESTPISLGQKGGRVRRKADDKEIGLVIDFMDPGRGKHWSKNRIKTYKQFGEVIEVKL